jgi:hypothetical protein
MTDSESKPDDPPRILVLTDTLHREGMSSKMMNAIAKVERVTVVVASQSAHPAINRRIDKPRLAHALATIGRELANSPELKSRPFRNEPVIDARDAKHERKMNRPRWRR